MPIWDEEFHRTNGERKRARQASERIGPEVPIGYGERVEDILLPTLTGTAGELLRVQIISKRRFEGAAAIQRELQRITAEEIALREKINARLAQNQAELVEVFSRAAKNIGTSADKFATDLSRLFDEVSD